MTPDTPDQLSVTVRASDALYSRLRPRRLGEVIGQPAVIKVLRAMLADGRLPHALLFAGPHGTGKTTIARILAKIANCERLVQGDGVEPCNQCVSCRDVERGVHPDVLEIDAASNRGVDAIRDVREIIQHAPTYRTRVIILDEAHQLTPEASNALLKSIEDPPDGCMFILCTTSPRDILPTIRSRCYEFTLAPLPAHTLKRRLMSVVRQAGRDIPESVIDAVVAGARGSMRDALSSLDKILAAQLDGCTPEELVMLVGGSARQVALRIWQHLAQCASNPQALGAALRQLGEAVAAGVAAADIMLEMLDLAAVMVMMSVGGDPNVAPHEREILKTILQQGPKVAAVGIMSIDTRVRSTDQAEALAMRSILHIAGQLTGGQRQ